MKLGIPLEMLLALERRKSGYEDMPKGASNCRTGRKRGERKKTQGLRIQIAKGDYIGRGKRDRMKTAREKGPEMLSTVKGHLGEKLGIALRKAWQISFPTI